MVDMEYLRTTYYLCRIFGCKDREAYRRYKLEKFTHKEFVRIRQALVGLFKLGATKGVTTYGELARYSNLLYGKNIPERGGSLARILGKILGILSTYSYSLSNLFISVLVENKYGKERGKGFNKMANAFGVTLDQQAINDEIRKAIDLCRYFESVNILIRQASKYISCPYCGSQHLETLHDGSGLDESIFLCKNCRRHFEISMDENTIESLSNKARDDIYANTSIKNRPEVKYCNTCGNTAVIEMKTGNRYICLWCGEVYNKLCSNCGEPFLSEGETLCDRCFLGLD